MNNTTSADKITINSNSIKNDYQPAIQYGWKCPSCGAVMAPWQSTCINCHGGGIQYPYNYPQVTYEPAPWWINPAYKWDITCGPSTTGSPLSDCTTVTSKKNPTTCTTTQNSTLQDKLKVSLKSTGINI